jgi:Flp pilus assembly pilin Flp
MAVTRPERRGDCEFRISDFGLTNPQFAIRNSQSLPRGQAAVEYAVLVAIVVAALISMAVYTKRALSGKWRGVGDTFGHGRQYEPGVTVIQ